jgi:catechol 2,3-dioxygenase-like lactoylglutathione lyase family enzyme
VNDLLRAVAWYRDALGFTSAWTDHRHAVLALSGCGVQLLLVETADPARLAFHSTHTGIQHSVVAFKAEDLEGLHAHLAAMGVEVGPLASEANGWAPRGFAFTDPCGNRLAAFSSGPRP